MTEEGTPVHHQPDVEPEPEQESLREYFRSELGRTIRGFGHALVRLLTAPGRGPAISGDATGRPSQSQETTPQEPPPPQDPQ
jgi:hypothetical protein